MPRVKVALNGTSENPFHGLGLTQNPFPTLPHNVSGGHELRLNVLGGDPIPHDKYEQYIEEKLKDFSPEFIALCKQKFVPGEYVEFDVYVGGGCMTANLELLIKGLQALAPSEADAEVTVKQENGDGSVEVQVTWETKVELPEDRRVVGNYLFVDPGKFRISSMVGIYAEDKAPVYVTSDTRLVLAVLREL